MTAKESWKIVYRRLRIARREAMKACQDMMVYGTGAVMVPKNGSPPYRIPPSEYFERYGR